MQKKAYLDRNNLTKPPLPAQIMHDLHRWSENEVSKKRRSTLPTNFHLEHKSTPHQ